MIDTLTSIASQDPPLAWAFVIVAVFALWFAAVLLKVFLEGQQAGTTTAAELRKDAHTAERRTRLRLLQGRSGQRRAS